eukprot:4715223-Prorocentrum_lima.AAC.1
MNKCRGIGGIDDSPLHIYARLLCTPLPVRGTVRLRAETCAATRLATALARGSRAATRSAVAGSNVRG